MKYINVLVFAGLLLCGLVLLIEIIFGDGGHLAIVAYFGWFLGNYSSIAYLVASALVLARGLGTFWATFYPINFGLTMLGISIFSIYGINDLEKVMTIGATAIVAVGVAGVLSRFQVLDNRVAPLMFMLILGTVFIEPLSSIWNYITAFMGVLLMANAFIAQIAGRSREVEESHAPV